MSDVGLNVKEGVVSGLTPFQEPAKRNIGLIMERERGVENVATRIVSLTEDRLIFGGVQANKYGAIVTRNMFKNAQGYPVTMYGVRVVGAGSAASTGSVMLPGATVSAILDVTAGRRGTPDKGTWGDDIDVYFYSKGFKVLNQWTLEVYYKGRFRETYSAKTVAEIQASVNSSSDFVVVNFSSEPDDTQIKASATGTIKTVTTAVPETKATASITITAAGADGNTIELSIGGVILGAYTKVTSDTPTLVAAGLKAAINAGTHGYTANNVAGALTVTGPTGSGATLNTLSMTVTIVGGITYSGTGTFSGGITAVPSVVTNVVSGTTTAFTTQLAVGSVLYTTDGFLIGTVASITNDTTLTLEKTALVTYSTTTSFKYTKYGKKTASLSGGVYNSPTEEDFYPVPDPNTPTGLACFDGVNVQIVATTEFNTLSMAVVGKDYATNRKDCIFLANLPYAASDAVVGNYATSLQTNTTSFAAGYNAWVKSSDETGSYQWVPAIGCVLGAAYIRTAALQGDHIHIPPGGIESVFEDIIDIIPNRITQDKLNQLTRDYTVNSIMYQENVGYYVATSRTYSTNPLYHSIHIRMMTSFYVRVLQQNLTWTTQKPNTPELKRQLITAIYNYGKIQYNIGAIERSVPFKNSWTIICDQTNNPRNQDRKELNCDIDWIPTEATEAVRISLNRNDNSLVVSEIIQ